MNTADVTALSRGTPRRRRHCAQPTPERRSALVDAVTDEGLREEVLGEAPQHVAERISPDLWELAIPRMTRPEIREIMVDLFAGIADSVARFPAYQAYLREYLPPTLIVWGPHDGYMPADAARAYLADLPDAELHLLDDAGHWRSRPTSTRSSP